MEKSVKHFAQNILGCGCPENVFEHIEVRRGQKVGNVTVPCTINIGNRLLVFIVPVSSADFVTLILPDLVNRGKEEREKGGFNRLRIVLATENPGDIEHAAKTLFQTIRVDEKLHLHIIPHADIPSCFGVSPDT